MFSEGISSKGQSRERLDGKGGGNEKKIVFSFHFREQCATFDKNRG